MPSDTNGFLELKVVGRLDAFWSGHLANELAEVIREGAHHIRLDLAEVTYLSSAGIRVMLQSYKQLTGIQGRHVSLGVVNRDGIVTPLNKVCAAQAL